MITRSLRSSQSPCPGWVEHLLLGRTRCDERESLKNQTLSLRIPKRAASESLRSN